jgi:hypothetical protein
MPIELFDLAKLIGGIILFIIPGYLWSFMFFKDLTRLERIVFGFTLSISYLIICMFVLDLILNIPITFTKTWLLFLIYSLSIIIIYIISLIKIGTPKDTFKKIKLLIHQKKLFNNPKTLKYLLLIGILFFAAYMGLLPHLKDNYFLPFHVDEWIHWSYGKSFISTGATTFTNPYIGRGMVHSLEPGFNYVTAVLSWLSGVGFNTMFVFMPALIGILASITAFNIGNRNNRPFGLEAALCITVIPTTCRMMGPGFFVPVALGLFYLLFLLWYLQTKKNIYLSVLVPAGLWVIFIIHPPSALAGIVITFLYAFMMLFDKEYTQSILHIIYSLVPIGGAFALSARYGAPIRQVIDAFFGGKYFLDYDLPQIWVSFEQMGIIIWAFAIIGIYFAFTNGKSIIRTIGLSAVSFLIIIGLYDKLGYGLPIMYERSYMFLFLMICLLAAFGVAELRHCIKDHMPRSYGIALGDRKIESILPKSVNILPFIVFILLVATIIPAHINIPYYHMITEDDYNAFSWIEENIASYRNSTNTYKKAAVDPFKASVFSAITRLYIVSSTMHPIPGYEHHQKVTSFLSGCCKDTSFLESFAVSVVYTTGCCSNQNLTMIYPNVYILQ